MNERGREVLVKAALDGVGQTRGQYEDRLTGAMCGLGALRRGLNVADDETLYEMGVLSRHAVVCPACGVKESNEGYLVIHLNDDHEFDLLTIARKLS